MNFILHFKVMLFKIYICFACQPQNDYVRLIVYVPEQIWSSGLESLVITLYINYVICGLSLWEIR